MTIQRLVDLGTKQYVRNEIGVEGEFLVEIRQRLLAPSLEQHDPRTATMRIGHFFVEGDGRFEIGKSIVRLVAFELGEAPRDERADQFGIERERLVELDYGRGMIALAVAYPRTAQIVV